MSSLSALTPRVNSVVVSGDLPRTAAKNAPARSFDYTPDGEGQGVLVISIGHEVTVYKLTEFGCGDGFDGRGFQLVKVVGGSDRESEAYDVFVSRNGQDHICPCKGFVYQGHCKHVDAMREVVASGALDQPESFGVDAEPFTEEEWLNAEVELMADPEYVAWRERVMSREEVTPEQEDAVFAEVYPTGEEIPY